MYPDTAGKVQVASRCLISTVIDHGEDAFDGGGFVVFGFGVMHDDAKSIVIHPRYDICWPDSTA